MSKDSETVTYVKRSKEILAMMRQAANRLGYDFSPTNRPRSPKPGARESLSKVWFYNETTKDISIVVVGMNGEIERKAGQINVRKLQSALTHLMNAA